jgi:hypothetical protein
LRFTPTVRLRYKVAVRLRYVVAGVALVLGLVVLAQTTNDPFPTPIAERDGLIRVRFAEFASIPDNADGAARMMRLVTEPGTRRLFVNDMVGPLYAISYDGRTVTKYVDINDAKWGIGVHSSGRERGFQSFAIHPQFSQAGARGFGKFYTWTDTTNTAPAPDFTPGGGNNTHDTVLLEWGAKDPAASAYDGGPPRELVRVEQPFPNHNGGLLSFNPLASPDDPDFGLLYVGLADGGSGGDPLNLAQNLGSPYGKILRIDPLGTTSANKKYGVPGRNPFANDGNPRTLGEIYAYGLRNPQRFGWDPQNSNLFVADIGQNTVEELSVAGAGANLGWNRWEGSFGFMTGGVSLTNRRGDRNVTYPVVEYDHRDPLLQSRTAITGVQVYRRGPIPQLMNLVLFGDLPSGEIFSINADKLPAGGQEAIRRILLTDGGQPKTFLKVIQEKNMKQGTPPAARADLRFGTGPGGEVFLLNKHDGTIRLLVADASASR